MSVDPKLLEILRCPETGAGLEIMKDDALEQLNQRITQGEVQNAGGEPVHEPLDAALITDNSQRCYPVDDGIPVLLAEEAIVL